MTAPIIYCNEGEAVSSLANKMFRDKAYEDIKDKMNGIMKGKTMIVGFYLGVPWARRYPTRPLKSPAPPMFPTALKCCIEIPTSILMRKLNGWVIFLPISTAKG